MRYTTTDGPKKPLNAIQEGSLGDKMGIAELIPICKLVKVQQFPISRYSLFLGGMRESAFVNFLEQSHDAAGGWPRYGEPPAVG